MLLILNHKEHINKVSLGGPLSTHRAYHFEISARDLARFGLLYLNHGRWHETMYDHEISRANHKAEFGPLRSVRRA